MLPSVSKICSIENQREDGRELVAKFCPERGMNLLSFTCGELEAMDQSTVPLFEQRAAGLGALIGPHFHHRNKQIVPKIENPARFTELSNLPIEGVDEPFSHGIGRYAPWVLEEQSKSHLVATLSGETLWCEHTLEELEGQSFTMRYEAKMTPTGLELTLSIVSEQPSVLGFHFYYALDGDTKAFVEAQVAGHFRDIEGSHPVSDLFQQDGNKVEFALDRDYDFGFFPAKDPLQAEMILRKKSGDFSVRYESVCDENSWQLWHPQGSSFVAIEPLSAKDPRKPHLCVSSLKAYLSFLA